MSSEQKITYFELYINDFFNNLEIFEDKEHGKKYKQEILDAVISFLKSVTLDSAYQVYQSFFRAYWIGIQEEENPFLKLMEEMKNFEKYAGRLTSKQRDHYIHSVFVFLIGMAIYEKSSNYRMIFKNYLEESKYYNSYNTKNEEFFYRWGLSSLFHDIAYPLEITLEQAKNYAQFLCSYPKLNDSKNLKINLELYNFEEFRKLPIINPNSGSKSFLKNYPDYIDEFRTDSIEIISKSISRSFSINFNDVNNNINNFIKTMKEENFIDHGLYSSVVMLRWYHHLIESTKWNPAYFYYPIADAASAIFLHNYFEHGLMKSFNLGPFEAKDHPIAYLLIFCDNLQEWKREFYGQDNSKNKYPFTDVDLMIDDNLLEIIYKLSDNYFNKSNFSEIKEKINKILDVHTVFKSGITIKDDKNG